MHDVLGPILWQGVAVSELVCASTEPGQGLRRSTHTMLQREVSQALQQQVQRPQQATEAGLLSTALMVVLTLLTA